mmetsp:Transcript_56365/g.170581  ORF Transcript_56365/g.170581 Transcript_56365/m.170581 type:complete len:238 (-) Transcript_56365:265-978(-)
MATHGRPHSKWWAPAGAPAPAVVLAGRRAWVPAVERAAGRGAGRRRGQGDAGEPKPRTGSRNGRAGRLGSSVSCRPWAATSNCQVEMGIYHCGVEVNGEEWSFQYYEDTWNDPTVSGLQRCSPMFMPEYEFQESIYLGPTPCSEGEVDEIIHSLELAYPACSYHITRKNCLTFAEHLAGLLKVPKPFPDSLKGILQASNNSRPADAIVDCTWSCLKRWMIWKHSTDGQGSSGICSLL